MKILRNLINTAIVLFSHYFLIGQNNNDHCDQYIENKNIQLYISSMEKQFLSENQIDSNYFNIIICTNGPVTSLFHVKIIDSTINYYDYIYEQGKFRLREQQTLARSIPKDLDKIDGFYQYWLCKPRTDTFSKCVSVYDHGILKSKIMFEGVEYSNSNLPRTEKLKDLFSILGSLSN